MTASVLSPSKAREVKSGAMSELLAPLGEDGARLVSDLTWWTRNLAAQGSRRRFRDSRS
jgi:hypothetical protein